MPRRLLVLGLLVAPALAEGASRENLERHVRTLASKEFEGRRGAGARKAERYIVKELQAMGLAPVVREHQGRGEPARNVVAVRQAGKEPAKEHVILSAHYDHLGRMGGFVFPGAADNAAGVAALLELARVLEPPPGRDLVFIAFDQEEVGFWGSDGYIKKPLRPLEECAAFLTMDILGRNLADAVEGMLFCVGTEHSDTLFDAVEAAEMPEGLSLAFAGADIVGPRSDFVPFLGNKVPFLFFSAGEYLDYHQPTDTAERLDYGKLLLEARAIRAVADKVLAAPRPRFIEEPVCRIAEPATLEGVVGRMLEQRKKLQLSDAEVVMGQIFRASLRQVVESGRMTKPQRDQIVATCRLMVGMLQQKR